MDNRFTHLAISMPITVMIAFVIASASPAAHAEQSALPNVVIIYTDDQGYNDVGCLARR